MSKRIPIKNHLQEIHLINQRSLIALVIMILLVIMLIARLGFLQLTRHDLYTTLSKKNWLDLVPIEPTRGLIYDRHGVLLAENIPIFSLDVIPNSIDNLPKTLADIAKIIPLSDTDIAQFQKELKQHRRFDEIPLKFRLSENEVARFYENQYRFPGVLVKARLLRHYPLGERFSHVLGYVSRINIDEVKEVDASNYSATNYIGKLGIEQFYEDDLHGTVGYEQAENDSSGEMVRVLNEIKPIPGKNIYLTIDSGLQKVAEDALTQAGFRGAIVAIQPSTGQVLAMVSVPSFDPNTFVSGIDAKDFQALQLSPDRPLYNRALRGLYPLASTIKPYLAIEGLDSGTVTPEYSIFDPGFFKLKNYSHIFHDWRPHGHGTVNLNRAIMCSCDTYFYNLASLLGINRIDDILMRFGFGDETGIDLYEELPGVVASPEWKRKVKGVSWYPGDTINTAIGQGFMQATPLQLAVGVAGIANRGVRYTPYLLLGEQKPGKPYAQEKPTLADPVKLNDPSYWEDVIHGMANVIASPEGTGFHLFGKAPYTVAAKTGTAQMFSRKSNDQDISHLAGLPQNLHDHTLLIAFAPVDHPQIAIAIIAENSGLGVSSESHGPTLGIARKILDYYFGVPQQPPKPTPTSNDNSNTATKPNGPTTETKTQRTG